MSTHVDKRRVIVHESDTQNWMEQLLVKVAPYSRSIVALLLAAIALGVVLLLWSQQNEQKVVSDWEQYYQAKDKDFSVSKLDDLKKKIKSLGDSTPGQLLKLQTGQLLMTEGVNDLYKDRTEAKKRLDEAEVMFKELASQTKLEQIREPAMFGLAICTESLGKIDDAIKLYGDMQAAYPHGMYAKSAELRVKRLKEANAKTFYSWFATTELPAVNTATDQNPYGNDILNPDPKGGIGGSEALDPLLKDLPNFNLPADPLPGTENKSDAPKESSSTPETKSGFLPPDAPVNKTDAPATPDQKTETPAEPKADAGKTETPAPAAPAGEPSK